MLIAYIWLYKAYIHVCFDKVPIPLLTTFFFLLMSMKAKIGCNPYIWENEKNGFAKAVLLIFFIRSKFSYVSTTVLFWHLFQSRFVYELPVNKNWFLHSDLIHILFIYYFIPEIGEQFGNASPESKRNIQKID